jgi:hypothetical protein
MSTFSIPYIQVYLKFCVDRLKSIVDKYVIRGLARSEYKLHDSAMRMNLAD